MTKLVIVGGGRMGEALLGGLVAAGWSPADLAVVEPVAARREELAKRFDGVRVSGEPVVADGAVIAVKPPDVPAAIAAAGAGRILSIAAGVTIAALEAAAARTTGTPSPAARRPRRTTSPGPSRSSAPWARSCAYPSTSSTR